MDSFCVFVIVSVISGSFCQIQDLSVNGLTDETEDQLSTVICTKCSCNDEGVIDCDEQGLTETWSEDEWKGLSNYSTLNVKMSSNYLGTLTLIPELPIRHLNLSNNRLQNLEEMCFKFLPDMESLDLSQNRLVNLDKKIFWGHMLSNGKFRNFVKMKRLSLAHNELHTLPKDIFSFMHDLLSLDISGNPLGIIDQVVMGSLTELTLLEELKMSACELDALPEGLLRRQRRLQRLDISENMFKTLPSVLREAVNLVSLNFDKNPITTIEGETPLSSLGKLQELSICRNTRLTKIGPNAMGGLENLVSLSICNNPRLSTLDDDFLTWTDDHEVERRPLLKELYLHNNNLTEIDSDFLFRWDQLQKMDFSDNPFVCDCTSQWMVDVLVPFIVANNGSADDMICKTPQDMRGLSFSSLHQSSKTLTCTMVENTSLSPTANMAIVLGVMIGIFVTFPLVIVVVLLWKRGYFAKCRRKMRNEEDSEDENGTL